MSPGQRVPASYETLYAWVVSWRKILAEKYEEKEFNPHSFRHSSLENYSDGTHIVSRELLNGRCMTLAELQLIAHHEDVSTTQSYLKSKDEEILLSAFGLAI